MADILKATTSPLLSEDPIRNQIVEIEHTLAEADAPIRIVDVRPTPSRLLYLARPEIVGRRSGRRLVSAADIRRGLAALAEQRKDWTIGFMPRVGDEPDTVGLIVRTDQQEPLTLRQVIVGSSFLAHHSTLALIIGVTIEQQLVVQDLDALGYLLIIGSEQSRQHFIRQALLTLLMLNTPAELRLALIGESSKTYQPLMDAPHTLGRLVDTPDAGVRLLEGLRKEADRRRQWFHEREVDGIDPYNALLQGAGEAPLPRIVMLFDALDDPAWRESAAEWSPLVYDMLLNGPRVGIHLLLTASTLDDAIPDVIRDVAERHLIMRSVNPGLAEGIDGFHQSLLRFVDAFFIQGDAITPIELCTVNLDDLKRLVSYWKQVANLRSRSSIPPKSSGLTDLLPTLETESKSSPLRPRTQVGTLARATRALSNEEETDLLARAGALAAYLGWLGPGPLRDILGLSAGEARAILAALQDLGVIEQGDAPMLRFIRLAHNPLQSD